MTELFGIALLPDREATERLVRFRAGAGGLISGPSLSLTAGRPHLTLLQGPFRPDYLTDELLGQIVAELPEATVAALRLGAQFGPAYVQPADWLFADVPVVAPGVQAQQIAWQHMGPHLDARQIERRRGLDGMTQTQWQTYLRYGYRYWGDEFRPHITLGHTLPTEVAPGSPIQSGYWAAIQDTPVEFTGIALYRAGEGGTLIEVLAERRLDGTDVDIRAGEPTTTPDVVALERGRAKLVRWVRRHLPTVWQSSC